MTWRSTNPADCCRSHTAALRLEVERLRGINLKLRQVLLTLLKDPHLDMLDEDRDEGWYALGGRRAA
jgi:hypothetical protein